MKILKAMLGLTAAAAVSLLAAAASAQTYPERTITMVVPFAAGGPTDTVARLVAESMSKDLGQQIVVENVGGAGGTLGAGRVASADPDGYTILLHHIGMATSATLYRKLAYDTLGAFDYVGLVTEVPMTIVARKDMEPTDLKGLIDYIKANKDKVTVANAGIGAASHLCGMMFMSAIQTPLTTVPYKGTGPAMTDLLGGRRRHVRPDDQHDEADPGRHDQGLCRDLAQTARRDEGHSDGRRSRAAGFRSRYLARHLYAEGYAG